MESTSPAWLVGRSEAAARLRKGEPPSMTTQKRGASIQASSLKPSIDLAKLVDVLAKAIESSQTFPGATNPKKRRLFEHDPEKNRLRICTSAVLLRLFSSQDFHEAFQANAPRGFVRDFEPPAFGLRAKLGGELTEGNASRLPVNVDKLMGAIDQALDQALPTPDALSTLLLENPVQQLKQLAQAAGAKFNDQAYRANLQPLAFDSSATGKLDPKTAVAKVLAAVEQVEADNYFEKMVDAIETHLENRSCDDDEIDDAIKSLEDEGQRADSQINRFLRFIDNEALSRVRLNVTCRIMEAIAEKVRSSTQIQNQRLVEYVDRVLVLLEVAKTGSLCVDLTAHYGQNAEFNLLDCLNRATFFSCLSVWPGWQAQIFEEKVRDQNSYGVQREVSYRFRINGNNPERSKPAYEARLDSIEESLLTEDDSAFTPPGTYLRLAELIVLDTVVPIPTKTIELITPEQLSTSIQARIEELRHQGKPGIRQLIQSLRDRASVMRDIADSLVNLLKRKGNQILSQAQRRTAQQFICVKRDIVAWSRLENANPGVKDLLVGSQNKSQEQVEWFQHIEIADSPDIPKLLFSVKVTTHLTEHSLVFKGTEIQPLQAQRLYQDKLLQVIWIPYQLNSDQHYKPSKSAMTMKSWALPAAIQLEYEIRTLAHRPKKRNDNTPQLHAAAITAFTILAYCCLWAVIKRLKDSDDELAANFTTLMLRLQETGKDSDSEGDAYVYAASQSIEAMLAQDIPVQMQGIVLNNLASSNRSSQYVKSGTFDALLSAFPLMIQTEKFPAIERIGLISYATRPSDEMPTLEQDSRNTLFLTQSYIASAVDQPFLGYELKAERTQSDIVTSPEDLQRQRIVREEIGYLKQQGCQHIILLSHAYGSRHINRAADHNSALTPANFLEEVFQTFPDLTIYPLLRDVFPATRLRKRGDGEAAFEIASAGDHSTFLRNTVMEQVREIIPVYTFATLNVVEEYKRPQSGFCMYFLVSDQRVSNITWTERARQHLLDPQNQSPEHSCLLTVLRGLHFIEAERGVKKGQLIPVLDPFRWISPTTKEAAGEVEIFHSRRRGQVYLSYPAVLTHIAQVLHRRNPHGQ
jgi:hypothetical protein